MWIDYTAKQLEGVPQRHATTEQLREVHTILTDIRDYERRIRARVVEPPPVPELGPRYLEISAQAGHLVATIHTPDGEYPHFLGWDDPTKFRDNLKQHLPGNFWLGDGGGWIRTRLKEAMSAIVFNLEVWL